MVEGEGIHIVNAAINKSGASVSVLTDVDGDGLLDLLITPLVNGSSIGQESYLISGKDSLNAIQADSLVFDLDSRFRGTYP